MGRNPWGRLACVGVLAPFLALAGCGGGGGGGGAPGGAPPGGIAPPPASGMSAAAGTQSVTVAWAPAAGAVSYNLYWANAPGVTKATGHRIANVTSPYTYAAAPGGTPFFCVVTAVGAGGAESAESAEVSAWSLASSRRAPDVGQYFDRGVRGPGPQNYDDNSGHPLRGLSTPDTALLFGGENCLSCHYISGPVRTSDECLKCHFENQPNAPSANHGDGVLQLAVPNGDALPTAEAVIASIADYDAWCLGCHRPGSTTSLGGITPSGRTVVSDVGFAGGRHRAVPAPAGPIGCIYCHHPHGRGNAFLVRENPVNRQTAAQTLGRYGPLRVGVHPSDNLSLGVYGAPQNVPFRARPRWSDGSAPYVPEADDDQAYCNKTCHLAKYIPRYSKDKTLKRDGTTGAYMTTGAPLYRKIFVIDGAEYTIDNTTPYQHQHPNGEIIPTDNMVREYAALIGLSGPSYYRYPSTGSALPTAYDPALSGLPFSSDYVDGLRDFAAAYGVGGRIAYRLTCCTCHDPHGSTFPNGPGSSGFPDLRLPKTGTGTLCAQCHS